MKKAFIIPLVTFILLMLLVEVSDPDGDGKARLDTVFIGGTIIGSLLGVVSMFVVSVIHGYRSKD